MQQSSSSNINKLQSDLADPSGLLSTPAQCQPLLTLLAVQPLYRMSDHYSKHREEIDPLLADPQIVNSPAVNSAVRDVLSVALRAGNDHLAEWITRRFGLGETLKEPGFREDIRAGLISVLNRADPNSSFQALHWSRAHQMSEAELSHPEVLVVARAVASRDLAGAVGCHYVTDMIPPSVLLADPAFESSAFALACSTLEEEGWNRFEQICIGLDQVETKNGRRVAGEWARRPEARAAAIRFLERSVREGDLPYHLEDMASCMQFTPAELRSDPGFEPNLVALAAKAFAGRHPSELGRGLFLIDRLRGANLIDEGFINAPEISHAGRKLLLHMVEQGRVEDTQEVVQRFRFEPTFYQEPATIAALQSGAVGQLSRFVERFRANDLGVHTNPLAPFVALAGGKGWCSAPAVHDAALPVIDILLSTGRQGEAKALAALVGFDQSALGALPGVTGALCRGMKIDSFAEWQRFAEAESKFLALCHKQAAPPFALLTREHYEAGKELHLTTTETSLLLGGGVDVQSLHAVNDWDGVVQALNAHCPEWQDPNVVSHFKMAREYLGSAEKVLQFMDRPGLLRHDALIEVPRLIEIASTAGIRPSAFFGQILAQVQRDNGFYEGEGAHHRLNHIARTYRYEEAMGKAGTLRHIPEVDKLASLFENPKAPFQSWAHLLQFARLQELLEKQDLLAALGSLPPEHRVKLAPFIDEVAIRPGSKADLGQAVQFLVKPESYLDASDRHVPAQIHEGKKPSNYLKIPHLDLTARELTLALVDGTYDSLQTLPPLQIRYSIPMRNEKGQETTADLVATLHRKGDPRGYTVQNDTGSCDAFGSGKQTVCAFNPEIAYFSVQLVRDGSAGRAIAQSMLTIDCDAGRSVPEVVAQLERRGARISDALSESVIGSGTRSLTCDNVEVGRNYRTGAWQTVIEQIYIDFFHEYLQQCGLTLGVRTDGVIVGANLTPVFETRERRANTWVPVSPPSYSDNIGAEVIDLSLSEQFPESARSIVDYRRPPVEALSPSTDSHIEFLRPSDSLATAYVEERAYWDNDSLVVSLHALQNTLIASHVNNRVHSRPDLSLKYVGDDGRLLGYLLAFEGRYKDDQSRLLPQGAPMIYVGDLAAHPDVRTVGGGRLVQAFIDRVVEQYAGQDQIPPLVAELREGTSYRLVMAKLRSIESRTGIAFEVSHGRPFYRGNEKMIPTVIQPRLPISSTKEAPTETLEASGSVPR